MSDTSTPDEIERRIRDASDKDDLTIHAITKVGENEVRDFYIVVTESDHDGREMFGVRYFAAGTATNSEDTWMKNGITARYVEGVMAQVGRGLVAAENRRHDDHDHAVMFADLTDDVE